MAERDLDFRMERADLVTAGQHVTMTESVLKTHQRLLRCGRRRVV